MMSSAPTPRPRVGIDFGTTNSVVVVATPDGGTHTTRFAFPAGFGSTGTRLGGGKCRM